MEAQGSGEKQQKQTQTRQVETSTGTDETSCSITTEASGTFSVDEASGTELTQESAGDADIVTKEGFSEEELIVTDIKSKESIIRQKLVTITHMVEENKHVLLGSETKMEEATALIADIIQETQTVISNMYTALHVLHDIRGQREVSVIHVTGSAEKLTDDVVSTSERISIVSSSPSDRRGVSSSTAYASESISSGRGTSRTSDVGMSGGKGTQSRTTQIKDASEDAGGNVGSGHFTGESGRGSGGGSGGEDKKKDKDEDDGNGDAEEQMGQSFAMEIVLCFHFTKDYTEGISYAKQHIIHTILSQPNPSVEMRLKDDNILVLHFPNTPDVSTVDSSIKQLSIYTIRVSKNDWEKIPKLKKIEILKLLSRTNLLAYISVTSNNTLELNMDPRLNFIDEPLLGPREQTDTTQKDVTSGTSEEKPRKKKKKEKHLETDTSPEYGHTYGDYSLDGSGDSRKDDSSKDRKKTLTSLATEKPHTKICELSLELLRNINAKQRRLVLEHLTSKELRELLLLKPGETLNLNIDLDSSLPKAHAQNQMLVETLLEYDDEELDEILMMNGRAILIFLKETDIVAFRIINFLEQLDIHFIMKQKNLNNVKKMEQLSQVCLEKFNLSQQGILYPILDEDTDELLMPEHTRHGRSEVSLHILRSLTTKQCKRALKHMSDEDIIKLLTSTEIEIIPLFCDISKKLTKNEKSRMGTLSKVLTKLKKKELQQLLKKSGPEILQILKKYPEVSTSEKISKMIEERNKALYEQKLTNDILEKAHIRNKLAAKEAIHLIEKHGFAEAAIEMSQKFALIEEAIQIAESNGFIKEAIEIAIQNGNFDEATRMASKYEGFVLLEEIERKVQSKREKEKLESAAPSSLQIKKKLSVKSEYARAPMYLSLDVLKVFDACTMKKVLNSLTDEEIVIMLMLEKGKYIKTFLKKENRYCITPCCMLKNSKNIIREILLKMGCQGIRHIMANNTNKEILEVLKNRKKRVKLKILDIQKKFLLNKLCEEELHVNLLSAELQKIASELLENKTLDKESKMHIKQLMISLIKNNQQMEALETRTQKPSTSARGEEINHEVKLYLTYESLNVYHIDTIKNVFKQLTDRDILKIFKLEADEYMEVHVVPRHKRKHRKKIKAGLLGKTLRDVKGKKLKKILNLESDVALETLKIKYENVAIALLEIDIEDLQEELKNKQRYRKTLEKEMEKLKQKDIEQKQMHKQDHVLTSHLEQTSALKEAPIPSTSTSMLRNIKGNDKSVTLYLPYGLLRYLSMKTVKKIFSRMTDSQILKLFLSDENECLEIPFKIKRNETEKMQREKEAICKCLLGMRNYKLRKLLKRPGEDALEKLMRKHRRARIRFLEIEHEKLKNQLTMEKTKNKLKNKEIEKVKKELKIVYLQQQKQQKEKQKKYDATHMVHQKQKGTVIGKIPSSDIRIKFTTAKRPIITVAIEDSYAHSVHENNLELQINLKPPLKDPKSIQEVLLLYVDDQPSPSTINIDPGMSSSSVRRVAFSDDPEKQVHSRSLFEITSYQETFDDMEENMLCGKQGVIQDHTVFHNLGCILRNEKTREMHYYETCLWEIEKKTSKNSAQFEHDIGSATSIFIFTYLFIYFIYKKFRSL